MKVKIMYEKDKQKRLIPCAVGDHVFFIRNYHRQHGVDSFYIQDKWKIEKIIITEDDILFDVGYETVSMSDLNKTCYLTRSIAEERLREKTGQPPLTEEEIKDPLPRIVDFTIKLANGNSCDHISIVDHNIRDMSDIKKDLLEKAFFSDKINIEVTHDPLD
jgi:hypothetical protein